MLRTQLSRCLLAAGVIAGVLVPTSSAHADASVTLNGNRAGSVLVQPEHNRVLVFGRSSWGWSTGDLITTVRTTMAPGSMSVVPGLNDAMAAVPSADGSRLYVARIDGRVIVELDASTLSEIARHSTGTDSPGALALVGNRLFVAGAASDNNRVVSYDVSDPTWPATEVPRPVYSQPGTSLLAAAPSLPGRLFVSWANDTTEFDVTVSPPALVRSIPGARVRLAAGGSRLVTQESVGDGSQAFVVRDTADLSVVGTVTTRDIITAVALSEDGSTLALARAKPGFPAAVVRTYRVGSTTPLHERAVAGEYPMGLTWSGSSLWVSSENSRGSTRYPLRPATLHRLDHLTRAGTTITLAAPTASPRGATLTVTGRLTFGGDHVVPGPRTVRALRSDQTGHHALATLTTDDDGAFTFTDTPPIGGNVVYTALFDGDDQAAPGRGARAVAVSRLATRISLTATPTTAQQQQRVVLVATLGPTYNSRVVSFYAQAYGGQRRLLMRGTTDAAGRIRYDTAPLATTQTFTAEFGGDHRYAPTQSSRRVGVLLGWAGGRIDNAYAKSGAYYLFRRYAKAPLVWVETRPRRSSMCLMFEGQQYLDGAWRTVDAPARCYWTGPDGLTYAWLRNDLTPFVAMRVRMKFGGDALNNGSYSPWLYLRFTS